MVLSSKTTLNFDVFFRVCRLYAKKSNLSVLSCLQTPPGVSPKIGEGPVLAEEHESDRVRRELVRDPRRFRP